MEPTNIPQMRRLEKRMERGEVRMVKLNNNNNTNSINTQVNNCSRIYSIKLYKLGGTPRLVISLQQIFGQTFAVEFSNSIKNCICVTSVEPNEKRSL